MFKNKKARLALALVTVVVMLVIVCFVGWWAFENKQGHGPQYLVTNKHSEDAAVEAGQSLSNGKCSGSGPGQLTHAAMDLSDYTYIIPYGVMTGGHVTPIDHQYYAVYRQSARDAYPVYAMGDAHIVDIEHRVDSPGDNKYLQTHKTDEYRLVFSQSCTFLYYYDLLTSLSTSIQSQFDANSHGGLYASVDIPIKAGDVVGRIGGQTLDFAVWNTQKKLSGFVLPDHYNQEPWKIYVADPLDYYSASLKNVMLSRYPRVSQPLSGKIDWDIDGTLRGNWFVKGTGYEYQNPSAPWSNQLSFAPDPYDPSHLVISIGDFGADPNNLGVNAQQFYVNGNIPDPSTVGPNSGLTKYELVNGQYVTATGQTWDRMSFVKGLEVQENSHVYGTALIQMMDSRTIRFESFPGKTAGQVNGFDGQAKVYTR